MPKYQNIMIEEKILFQMQTNIFKKRLYLLVKDALACNDWLRTINQEYVIVLVLGQTSE